MVNVGRACIRSFLYKIEKTVSMNHTRSAPRANKKENDSIICIAPKAFNTDHCHLPAKKDSPEYAVERLIDPVKKRKEVLYDVRWYYNDPDDDTNKSASYMPRTFIDLHWHKINRKVKRRKEPRQFIYHYCNKIMRNMRRRQTQRSKDRGMQRSREWCVGFENKAARRLFPSVWEQRY